MTVSKAALKLIEWYARNKRELPWRENRDPYRIWVSETMLQQTTTTAVIPFFERFVERFPTLEKLSDAAVNQVVEAWAGLGYYSRARNLHKSAQALHAQGGFPKTYEALIEFPGFGPYTARSVASLAFDQPVGVVDGNVIRVLSRFEALNWEWWKPKVRDEIQIHADNWVQGVSSYDMNQALMELGRTICTPKTPSCLLCPIRPHCQAYAKDLVAAFPKPKPRKERELWLWNPTVEVKKGRILIQKNTHAPFLRGQWLLPGTAQRLNSKPKSYHYKHSITHHDIFVTVRNSLPKMDAAVTKWVQLKELRQHVPASLVQKALQQVLAGAARATDADGLQIQKQTRRAAARSKRSRRRL